LHGSSVRSSDVEIRESKKRKYFFLTLFGNKNYAMISVRVKFVRGAEVVLWRA